MSESERAVGRHVEPAIRVLMMPKDTNAYGTIFGGVILSYIDQAGAIEGYRHVPGRLVTVAMREVAFLAPVFVGDLVAFYTETLKLGRTSVTVRVTVQVERTLGSEGIKVTEAEVIFVHVDEDGQPRPIRPEPIATAGAPGDQPAAKGS